ncbi:neuronal acetylcholine receptor subunit beta-3-like isoform X2 [Clytia hemisphaerica]|uniref:Uncharacterized protein n=1 Tax=Clytia hemisphaerica TaxID=252671 RepID=A0A7M5X9L4_9CNID
MAGMVLFPTSNFITYLDEQHIIDKVMEEYRIDVRPQIKAHSPVKVKFDVRMKGLNSLNVKEQMMSIDAFLIMNWFDPRLTWNKTLYNDTDKINLRGDKIWTPDIMLINRGNPVAKFHTELYISKVLVFNDGNAVWSNLVTLDVSCDLDVTWFPVDKQECSMKFGSWSYDRTQLSLVFLNKPNSTTGLKSDAFNIDSGEWVIEEFEAEETIVRFSCCPMPFSVISYTLSMSRVSLYYFMYILLPLVSLAFLFLLVFHIPADSGERMGFGVTILLSITVYLLVISEKLPEKSNDAPMLGICFITIFYILIFALMMAAGTTIFARRVTKPPEWLLNLTTKGCFKLNSDDLAARKVRPVMSKKFSCGHMRRGTVTESDFTLKSNGMLNGNGVIVNGNCHDEADRNAIHHRRPNTPKVFEQDNPMERTIEEMEDQYNDDWIKICRALDKKLFIFFLIVIILIPIIVTVSLDKTGLA